MGTGMIMECSLPPPLTEDEISAASDGRQTRRIRSHLQACAFCSDRVESAKRFDSALGGALHRFDCPPAQRLGDYLLNMLTTTEAADIEQHLEVCARCTNELAELRASMLLEQVIHPLASEAKRPTTAKRSLRLPRLSLDEIIATILPNTPTLAYRGIATNREPIVAEVGDTVVSLDVKPAKDDQVQVTGLLASIEQEEWIGALAFLWIDDTIRATSILDDNGGFAFDLVPSGNGTLRITPEHGPTLIVLDLTLH